MFQKVHLVTFVALLSLSASFGQTPCVNGMAGEYPCNNIELMGFMGLDELGGGEMNDVWGWVDPSDGTEYVLQGRTNGTAFVDISDPLNPVLVANLPTETSSSLWRDIKVHDNHAFVVSEASGHGMQVVDLTQLGSITNPPQTIVADALYTGWGSAHNVVINESTGRAYGVGTGSFDGGLNIVDINNPTDPVLIGGFAGDGYTHDAQVVSYIGPDAAYAGKEIAFCCNTNTVTIVDVTDAGDATLISSTGYSNSSYTHQGWLTEDHRYFISNDELDEQDFGTNTTSFIWDVTSLDSPQLIGTFVSESRAIDHNMYVLGSLIYQSNYRAGLRVLDATGIASGQLEEVGYFDLYPASDAAQFNGTWSNYPYFPSGIIAVSHIEEGLFLLRLSNELSDLGCTDPQACNFDPTALEDNGMCLGFNECGGCEGEALFCIGCTDSDACNYSGVATIDDGTCFEIEAPDAQSAVQTTEPITFTEGDGTHWFASQTDLEPLSIGASYTLPLASNDQSIWVANSNGEYNLSGGKAAPDFANGQHHTNNANWLRFDVHQDALLESVDVYSEGGGTETIEIVNANDDVIWTASQELTTGLNVFVLNAELPAGEEYQIRSANPEPLLWRDDNGADVNYPYDIGGLASIFSTTITGQNQYTYYYFYYNWKMSSFEPCLSERVEFNVTVEDISSIGTMHNGSPRTLVKTMDLLGRDVQQPRNQIIFRLYSDGTVEKQWIGDRWR
jgi:choice-of-anchor B domain-containing protein